MRENFPLDLTRLSSHKCMILKNGTSLTKWNYGKKWNGIIIDDPFSLVLSSLFCIFIYNVTIVYKKAIEEKTIR